MKFKDISFLNSHNEDPGSTQLVMLQASIPKVYLYHSYKKVGGYYQHPKSKYDSYFFTSLQLKCGRRHDCSLIIRLLLLEENSEFFLPGRRRGEKLEIIIQFQRAGGLNLERGPWMMIIIMTLVKTYHLLPLPTQYTVRGALPSQARIELQGPTLNFGKTATFTHFISIFSFGVREQNCCQQELL